MKPKTFLIKSIFLGLLLISASSFAQEAVISIVDENTNEPCSFANVVLYDLNDTYLKGTVSDENGIVKFNITEKSKITVSYVGYINSTEFILPGEKKTIKLKTNLLDLEEVVVTGQYTPRKADQSIYKIDVINSKTIMERGVNNLAEALSNETGIRISSDPSTGTSIILQGMGGENVKYLIDGVPIVGRVDGNVDLTQINMENIDHIEIVKGPMSVVYGTSALAGVINIITKQNTRDKNVLKVNSYIDNKTNYNVGFYTSLIRGNHTVSLSANRNIFQGIDINLNTDTSEHIVNAYGEGKDRYMEFKPKRVINADFEYAYRKDFLQIRFKSQYMNLLLKNYLNPSPMLIAYDSDYYTTRSTNSLTLSNKLSEALSYNIIGAYTYFERNTDHITSNLVTLDKTITGTSSTLFQNGMTRGNFTYFREGSALSYQFGWDVNYDIGTGDKIAEGASMGDYAAFLSAQYIPFPRLSFQPGLRYIYNSVYDANLIFGLPIVPSINLQWTIIDNLNFRLSYAKGFRAPSLKELYLDFKDSNHNLEGNTDLKAEKSDSYNASFSYKFNKGNNLIKFDPSFFFNDGKDAISMIVTDAETNSATNVNFGGYRTFGTDIGITYMHLSGLTVGLGYSLTGQTFGNEINGNIEYVPVVYYNNYSVNAKYLFRKFNATLMANLKWYGETPHISQVPEGSTVELSNPQYPESFIPDVDSEGYYFVRTEAYQDLEVTFTKNLWHNKVNLIIGGKNLMNNKSIRNFDYISWGQDNYSYESFSPKNYGRTFFLKFNLKL